MFILSLSRSRSQCCLSVYVQYIFPCFLKLYFSSFLNIGCTYFLLFITFVALMDGVLFFFLTFKNWLILLIFEKKRVNTGVWLQVFGKPRTLLTLGQPTENMAFRMLFMFDDILYAQGNSWCCTSLLGLFCTNITIDDVPHFTVGVLSFGYQGWSCSQNSCLHAPNLWWKLQTLGPERTSFGRHFTSFQFPARKSVSFVWSQEGNDLEAYVWFLWTSPNVYFCSVALTLYLLL